MSESGGPRRAVSLVRYVSARLLIENKNNNENGVSVKS